MINVLFTEIGLMIIIATIGAYIAKLLKQPLIPAYIITGVIVGPVLGLITNTEIISALSEIGIAFLLFIVGLELSFKKLKYVGGVTTAGGILQFVSLFFIALLISQFFLGFSNLEATYIALALAFSSTMVVIKLLSDKKELDTLHGRIIIGLLLMQDIIAILALSLLTTKTFSITTSVITLLGAISLLVLALLSGKYIFPVFFKFAARSQELLFLLAISVLFLFGMLFSFLHISIAIGAFVAGVALANLPYNVEIVSRVRSLRDFFAVLFFTSLGMQLVVGSLGKFIVPIIVFTLFIILVKPLVILFVTSFFRYTKKTSFLTAISLAQISEFSLIIAAQGMLLNHISQEIFTMIVVLATISITTTSYFIQFDNQIYRKLAKYLEVFEINLDPTEMEYIPDQTKKAKYDIILCGYDRIGYSVLKTLEKMRKKFIIVDFNPDIIKHLVKRKINCLYGDISDVDILERLNLKDAETIVSTIPDLQDNKLLIHEIKKVNKRAAIFVTADRIDEALELYNIGADYVILPHFLGGEQVSVLLENHGTEIKDIIKNKFTHISDLKKRIDLGHYHPVK